MSTPGLFVPTYGKPAKVCALGNPKNNNRVIPSKSAAYRSLVNKRSLMPSLVFNGKIEYVQSFEAAESAARAIIAARPEVLGFDIEWQVSFVAGEAPRPTATLQLCASDRPAYPKLSTASSGPGQAEQSSPSSSSSSSSVWGTAFVFHLSSMRGHPSNVRGLRPKSPSPLPSTGDAAAEGKGVGSSNSSSIGEDEENAGQNHTHNHAAAAFLPESLVRVLSDPGILLAGVGVGGDVNRLEGEYEQLRASGVGGVVDLSEVAKRKVVPDRRRRGMWSLADLCDELLQLKLRKPNSLRTGSWEKRPLSVDQLFYAAADAYAGLRLWQVMQGMPDLVLQRAEANAPRRDTTAVAVPLAVPQPSNTVVMGDAVGSGSKGKVEAKVEKKAYEQPALGAKATSSGDADDNKDKAPAASRVPPRLPQSKLETHRLWHDDGLSVDAVAEVRCIKASTVRGYLSDCIEAGLPYDWSRLGIDSNTEEIIFRALLAAIGNHRPAAAGCGPTTALSTSAKTEGEEPDAPSGASDTDGKHPAAATACGAKQTRALPLAAGPVDDRLQAAAAALSPPTPVAAGAHGVSCGGATPAVETAEGQRGEEGGGDGSRSATAVAMRGVSRTADVENGGVFLSENGGNAEGSIVVRDSDVRSHEAGIARVAPIGEGGGAEDAKGASEIGRWDSVKLKEVKELAPSAEYWEIRMVLARLKAGYSC